MSNALPMTTSWPFSILSGFVFEPPFGLYRHFVESKVDISTLHRIMHSSVPILLACAIALISPSTAEVTVHHTTTKTVFRHACPNTTLHTSGYPSASTNRPATTSFNSTTRDLCPLTRNTNLFVNETMPSPTGTAACTLPSGLGANCMETLECCWPLWCDVSLGVCGCPGEGSAIPPPFPTTSITSISSKAPPSPIGNCTLPSTVGADCGHTGQCCSPLWCDKSTYLCASPSWGSGLLPPPGGSSISTFSTALSARSGGCIFPSTVGADCSGTLACCSPLECDLTTKLCVPSRIASPVASSSSSPPSPTACSDPNTVGASCNVTGACCAPLFCQWSDYTCVDPTACSNPSTEPMTIGANCSSTGYCCSPLECSYSRGNTCIDPNVCSDPNTVGADCSSNYHCCSPLVCDGLTSTCREPDGCSYPNAIGADCTNTQRCCSPLVCDRFTNTCKDPNVCTDPSIVGADCGLSGHCCPPLVCAGPEISCIDPSCTDPRTLGASCRATGRCCPPYVCDAGQTCVPA